MTRSLLPQTFDSMYTLIASGISNGLEHPVNIQESRLQTSTQRAFSYACTCSCVRACASRACVRACVCVCACVHVRLVCVCVCVCVCVYACVSCVCTRVRACEEYVLFILPFHQSIIFCHTDVYKLLKASKEINK